MNEKGVYLLSTVALFLILWLIGYQVHHEIHREELGLNRTSNLAFYGMNTHTPFLDHQAESLNQAVQRRGVVRNQSQSLNQQRAQFVSDFASMLFAMQGGHKPEYLQLRIFLNRQQTLLENKALKQEEALANINLLQTFLPEYQHELTRASAKLKTRYSYNETDIISDEMSLSTV